MALYIPVEKKRNSQEYKILSSGLYTQEEYKIFIAQGLKWCPCCKVFKEIDSFYFDNKEKNIRHSTCRKCVSEQRKPTRSNYTYVYRQYRNNAKNRGYQFNLTEEHFQQLSDCVCYYCGINDTEENLGYDRVDNTIGYIESNIVPCCSLCNYMKSDLTEQKWKEHMTRVINYSNSCVTLLGGTN